MARLRTRHPLWTTLLVVASLLFAQWAWAGYVCPASAAVGPAGALAMGDAPCHGMDAEQPMLCLQHASTPSQHVDPAQLLTVPPPLLARVLVLPPIDARREIVLRPPRRAATALHGTPEPLFLSTRRLRV